MYTCCVFRPANGCSDNLYKLCREKISSKFQKVQVSILRFNSSTNTNTNQYQPNLSDLYTLVDSWISNILSCSLLTLNKYQIPIKHFLLRCGIGITDLFFGVNALLDSPLDEHFKCWLKNTMAHLSYESKTKSG